MSAGRFLAAEHHRRRGPHPQVVRLFHHRRPVAPADLVGGDLLAHRVDQHLGAAAGDRVEAGGLQPRQARGHGEVREPGDVDHLGRRQGVDLQPREAGLDLAKEALEPVDLQFRVQPPLHQQLGAAVLHQFLDFGEDRLVGKDVGVRRVGLAVEGAELTLRLADVSVVDVAVDDECHPPFRVLRFADGIGELADGEQVGLGQQPEGFGAVDGDGGRNFPGNRGNHGKSKGAFTARSLCSLKAQRSQRRSEHPAFDKALFAVFAPLR